MKDGYGNFIDVRPMGEGWSLIDSTETFIEGEGYVIEGWDV